MSTDLYDRTIAHGVSVDGGDLAHNVWDGTPWMIEVQVGRCGEPLEREILEWCLANIGEEAHPFSGSPGDWRCGNAVVDGTAWFGFATEESMRRFQKEWPENTPKAD